MKLKRQVEVILITIALFLPPAILWATTPLEQAEQKESRGDYEGAIAIYQKILEKEPENEPALLGIAQSYYWQGNYEASAENYEKVLKKNPNHIEALLGASKAHLAMGHEKKSKEYLKRAEKVDPNHEEVEAIEGEMGNKTKIRLGGGYIFENSSYTSGTQGQFTRLTVQKEKTFGFGLETVWLRKFSEEGFSTELFGHYYLFPNFFVGSSFQFSPRVEIQPHFGTSASMGLDIEKFHPQIRYTFDDYAQTNRHAVRPGIAVDIFPFLQIRGDYEWGRLTPATGGADFHSLFSKLTITPTQWLKLFGHYDRIQNSFEGGRTPTPFVSYTANIAGGGIGLDFLNALYIEFSGQTEDRNNGESLENYLLSFGYSF